MRLLALFLALASFAQAAADPDFTFVFVPDQHPFAPYDSANAFKSVIAWIRANRSSQNIQAVLAGGDWVNGADNVATQLTTVWSHWGDPTTGVDSLTLPGDTPLPWISAIGNHDYTGQFISGTPCGTLNPNNACGIRDSAAFTAQMGYDRISAKPWFESYWNFDETPGSNLGPGKPNYAIRFAVASHKFLVIALEIHPRTAAMDWAANLISSYPDHYVVYVTHNYQLTSGARTVDLSVDGPQRAYSTANQANAASGEDLWNYLVKTQAKSLLVLAAHQISGTPTHAHLTSTGTLGQSVHQVFTNYQEVNYGTPQTGNGYITLLKFRPSLGQIEVKQFRTHACSSGCEDPTYPMYTLAYTAPNDNQPPTVDAGADQTVQLSSAINLTGSASDDGLPSGSLTTTWSQVSGPGTAIFGDANSLLTTVTAPVAGTYVFRLSASDLDRSSTDDLMVTVLPEPATDTSGRFDKYGGSTDLKCANGIKDRFYTEKIKDQWWFCTPLGNVFFMKSVYNVNAGLGTVDANIGYSTAARVTAKYGDTSANWGVATVTRAKSMGLNALAEYPCTHCWITSNPLINDTNAIAFSLDGLPARYGQYDSVNQVQRLFPARSGVPGHKEFMRLVNSSVYGNIVTGGAASMMDVWDENPYLTLRAQWSAAGRPPDNAQAHIFDGANAAKRSWTIGATVDDGDWMAGTGSGPCNIPGDPTATCEPIVGGDVQPTRKQAHIGYIILNTAPFLNGTGFQTLPGTFGDTVSAGQPIRQHATGACNCNVNDGAATSSCLVACTNNITSFVNSGTVLNVNFSSPVAGLYDVNDIVQITNGAQAAMNKYYYVKALPSSTQITLESSGVTDGIFTASGQKLTKVRVPNMSNYGDPRTNTINCTWQRGDGTETDETYAVEAGPSNTLCAKFALRKFLQSRYTTIGALNTAWGLTASTMPRAFTTFDSSQTVYSDVLVATSDGSTATYMFTLPNVSVASELTKNSLRLYVNGKVLGFDYCHQLTGPANKCNAATGSPNFGIGVNTGPIYGSNLLGYPTRANNHATMSKVNYLTGAVTLVLSWPYPAGTEIRADYTTGGFGTPQGTGLLDTWNMATLSGASSTLSAAVTSTSALTITVTDGSVFGTTVGVIRIDGEYMNVCSKSGNTMTICSGGRGYIGSVAATHSSGATVDQLGIAHTLIGYGCANSASSCAWKTDLDDFLYWHMRQYFLNVRQVLWEQDLSTSTGPGAGLTGAAARAYCATKGNCLMYFGTTYLSGWGGTPARDKVLQAARGIVDIFPGNSTPLDSPISERDNNMLRHIYAHMGDVPIVTWESFRANEAPAGFRGTSCGANRTATISNAVVNEGLATITMPHGSGAGAPGMWFKITGNTILNGTYQMNTSQAIDSFTFWTTAPAGSYPGGTVQIYRMMDSSKDGHSRLNLTTQAERGAAVKSWMQSALDMSYPNGSRPYVGYRWWEWHDNYGECSNWGLVNLNDDLFDGSSGRATGFDDSGKPTGGWPLGGYTDFNSRFKEANALWLNSIYRTVKQMRGNVILGGDVR